MHPFAALTRRIFYFFFSAVGVVSVLFASLLLSNLTLAELRLETSLVSLQRFDKLVLRLHDLPLHAELFSQTLVLLTH
jgi:hypothetical protein